MNKSFLQVDVFTSQPLRGNPAAVVFDADDLDARTMQRIAREMNLSETVFVLAPESPDTDYRVRIFTPSSELPFAGHPTIATASAVRAHRGDLVDASLLRQACGIGIVPVEVVPTEGSPIYWMTQASPQFRNTAIGPGEMSALLGCDANMLAAMPVEVVSTGIPWLIA
ncbi:PhzF family phenazine biosynthesis protein, partial [Pseudomonas aeruginosa]|nr:PhzF family phenazine biosynthesis protein [Pseudomonas aeruginosa]